MRMIYRIKLLINNCIQRYRQRNLTAHGGNVSINRGCVLKGNIECGDHVNIGRGAYFISTLATIRIHDYVVFGPNVTIYTGDHPMDFAGKHICEITDSDKLNRGGVTTRMLQLKLAVG